MLDPIAETRGWIETVVIGLNLCPFARRVFDGDRIRFRLSETHDAESLRDDLKQELVELVASSQIETAILIHPHALTDFLDYNDFLSVADDLLAELDLVGIIQIASFHPHYRFARTAADAIENHTNRSPYPMLHLLREASITAVADDAEFLAGIPERNMARLRALGIEGLLKIWKPE